MTLTLRAVSLNDRALTQPITAHFGAAGGSIGRDDRNTLALPDPERYISRQQAEISAEGSGYRIKNVGSANPIVVRGQALARGESAALAHHDQVRIGGYALEVIQEDRADSDASTITRGRAAVDARSPPTPRHPGGAPGGAAASAAQAGPGGAPGLGDLGAPLSSSNPFADLLGDATPARPAAHAPSGKPRAGRAAASARDHALLDPFTGLNPPPAGVAAASPAWAAPPAAQPRAFLPDDFDPFAAAAPQAAPAPPAALSAGAGVFGDLIPGANPVSIDALIDRRSGERDPLAGFLDDVVPGSSASDAAGGTAPGVSTDPMAMFDPLPPRRRAGAALPTPADDVPEWQAAFVPPPIRASAPPPPAREAAPPAATPQMANARGSTGSPSASASASAPAPAPGAQVWQGDPQALWRAFCEGAGMAFEPTQGVDPELMRTAGSVLGAAVAGTLQLMSVRATAKHELRAQVTVIQARNNNPLKFSPDAGAALEQLLKPPLRGFLAGPAAMTDAMHDLVGHTIGTMAGTRAALEGVLERFTPRQLEDKLAANRVLDNLLPMNRKAKLWELYLRHFDAIRNEAQDDFHTLFGRAFLAAYEQQLDRLQHGVPGKPPGSA